MGNVVVANGRCACMGCWLLGLGFETPPLLEGKVATDTCSGKKHNININFFGPNFLRTFLTLTRGCPGGKEFLPTIGAAGNTPFGADVHDFGANVHDLKGS